LIIVERRNSVAKERVEPFEDETPPPDKPQYTPCEHCAGWYGHHERWCRSINGFVGYAFKVLDDPTLLISTDIRFLHELESLWDESHRIEADDESSYVD
jgi:hypothetical protein